MNAQPEEQSVRSPDGTRIGFVKMGSGPALVLVHGVLNTADQWLPVAIAMSDHCMCFVMDRRSRGRSGDGADYSLDRQIEDIQAVLDAAGPGASLLGHSSGAIYALETARRFPVGRLVLYEPPLHFQGPKAEGLVDRIRAKVESKQFENAVTIFLKEEARVPEDALSGVQATPLWDQMVALAPTLLGELEMILRLGPSVERYRDVSIPTLLLSGTETVDHPSFATKALQDTLPNVRKAMLDGQGHGANGEAPDMVARAVTDFLLAKL